MNPTPDQSPPAVPSPPSAERWFVRVELVVALLVTLSAVCFHWIFLRSAGGLWRDEAGFVGLSTLPSWADLWQMLTHDSSPILAPALMRIWCAMGFGQTDFALRIFGFGVGLLLIGGLWVAGWILRRGFPVLALVLVAANVVIIRYGDSLRAYGLGSLLNVLLLALVWRATEKPTRTNLVLAAVAAVLSVQALYQNAVFVLAACGSGSLVCVLGRRWRDSLIILGVGLLAALSLVPYVGPIIHSQEWWILERAGFNPSLCWQSVSRAAGIFMRGAPWLWVALCGIALVAAGWNLKRVRSPSFDARLFFNACALFAGLIGFFVFILISQLPTRSWYYVPLLVFVAVCLDGALGGCRRWPRLILSGFALVLLLVTWLYGVPYLKGRQTSMDLVAAELTAKAGRDDLIIVHPWYGGVSFGRYYHGSAPWVTVPPLADHTFHRYDLLKVKLQEEHPIGPVLEKMAATLKAGRCVWLVGNPGFGPPEPINPAPNNSWGWFDYPYVENLGAQVGSCLATNAVQIGQVAPLVNGPVNGDESDPVFIAVGWKPGPEPIVAP